VSTSYSPASYSSPELNGARAFIRRLSIGGVVLLALAAAAVLQLLTTSTEEIPRTDKASINLAVTSQVDLEGVLVEVLGEPYHFDH
jgi:hypothetical protein